jgi:hypothetical protein
VKEKCPSRCSADVFSRVDLAARAREAQGLRLHDALRSDPASPPPRRDLLGPGPFWGPFLDLAVDRVPTRSYRRSLLTTSLVRRSRRARSPPLSGRSASWAEASGHAWVRPGGDPGPFDRCLLLTDSVFKDDRLKSRRTSHRHVPTRYESSRIHAATLTSANRPIAPGCCLPQPPIRSAYL